MKYRTSKSKYDRFPETRVKGYVYIGITEISEIIKKNNAKRIVFECYPGVDVMTLSHRLTDLLPDYTMIHSDAYTKSTSEIQQLFSPFLTHDRVFGKMNDLTIEDVYDQNSLEQLNQTIESSEKTIIYGFGASLVKTYDCLFYIDITRWEIQQRFRHKGLQNWKSNDDEHDILKKFKYGYFIEWRIADRLKQQLWNHIDYYVDGVTETYKCVSKYDYDLAINRICQQPFRFVPYFDQGVWGGTWMKEVCNLDASNDKYAWCFDGVAEENSIRLRFDNDYVESPAMNLVLFESVNLLGEHVISKFGKEFPIRFDFLDTMEGQNLSLQVHPSKAYIKSQFGMKYTQDESYYILDSTEDSKIYLGVKTGIDKQLLIDDLKKAEVSNQFDDESYINQYPVKKHDHISIPNGTIHCSGKNTMVLEISSTPYIFTFKLWDWNRVGLDGRPRPIHIDHGKHVIDIAKNTEWVEKELLNQTKIIYQCETYKEESTGLHASEFIETRRHTFIERVEHQTYQNLNVLNLVEGDEIIVESPAHAFEPLTIHYAETFIIPASVQSYTIKPVDSRNQKPYKTIKAYIR